MNTITIQIGNSDDKLTQAEWHNFVSDVKKLIESNAANIHFFGFPAAWEKWQNVAWVIQFDDCVIKENFIKMIKQIRSEYSQDSVAWTEGETIFI